MNISYTVRSGREMFFDRGNVWGPYEVIVKNEHACDHHAQGREKPTRIQMIASATAPQDEHLNAKRCARTCVSWQPMGMYICARTSTNVPTSVQYAVR
eukprot:2611093-Amphidinium_carterae.1